MRGITDIHNHILPMVDDGAKSVVEALKMLKMQENDGVEKCYFNAPLSKGNV